MNANFFNQIAQVDFTGVLQLHISKGAEANLIGLVVLNNEQCGDDATASFLSTLATKEKKQKNAA